MGERSGSPRPRRGVRVSCCRIPAFGAGGVTTRLLDAASQDAANGAPAQGAHIFAQQFGLEERLGPLFNGRACETCHNNVSGNDVDGGMGATDDTFVFRVAHVEAGLFDPLLGRGGPVARQHSVTELGVPCDLPTGIPAAANVISKRSAMTLRGTSLLDNIRIVDIERTRLESAGRRARPHERAVGRPRRQIRVEGAQRDARGIHGRSDARRARRDQPARPDGSRQRVRHVVEARSRRGALTSLVAFLDNIDPPLPAPACLSSAGAAVFHSLGCDTCHQPNMFGPGNSGASPTTIHPFTDLLLHDMGPGLADGIQQGSATGSEFRTMPLWRVADRVHFLHDGRAATIVDAIKAHGGQAAGAKAMFDALGAADLQALMNFLGCI